MSDQDWLRPALPSEGSGTAWNGPPPSRFELRPLSLGEILDRTFAVYRSRFWLFAGISMVAASVQVVAQAFSLMAVQSITRQRNPFVLHAVAPQLLLLQAVRHSRPALMPTVGAAQVASWIVALIFVLVSAITQAATALALTEVYLHRETSVKSALTAVARRWYSWIGIALWQAASAAWLPALVFTAAILLAGFGARSGNSALTVIGGLLGFAGVFGAFPVGFILYLRNALAVPAAVTEGLKVRPAMRRSKALAAGSKGRIFVVLLIAACLYWVVAVLESPATFLMLLMPNQQHYLARGLALLITFIGHTAVAPVALIGLTLLYFDQRVRKEAFDLELLLQHARESALGSLLPAKEGIDPERYAPLG